MIDGVVLLVETKNNFRVIFNLQYSTGPSLERVQLATRVMRAQCSSFHSRPL